MPLNNLVKDEQFPGSDTSTGGASTTTGWGSDGWTDVAGSVLSISSHVGNIKSAGNTSFHTTFATRPSGENQQDQRVVFDFTWSVASNAWYATLRYQNAGDCYLCGFEGNNSTSAFISMYHQVGGVTSSIGSGTLLMSGLTLGHSFEVDCQVVGVSPSTLSITCTDTTASTVVGTNSGRTDSTAGLQNSGQYGVTVAGTANNQVGFTRVRTYSTSTALAAGTPSFGTITATSVALSSTAASGGTPGYTYQWYRSTTNGQLGTALSGKTTLSETDTSVVSATTYYYTIRVTDSTSATADSVQISTTVPAQATVDATWLSPGWNKTNLASNGYVETNECGQNSGVIYTVAAGGAGNLFLILDGTNLVGATAGPTVAYSVDGNTWNYSVLSTGGGELALQLGSGLAAGAHTFDIIAPDALSDTATDARWVSPKAAVRIKALRYDATGSITAQARPTKKIRFRGDSITQDVTGGTGGLGGTTQSWPRIVALGLGYDLDQEGFSGTGWTITGNGSVPPLFTPGNDTQSSWNKYDSATSRLSGGFLLDPADIEVVNLGTNDRIHAAADAAVTASVAGYLPAARAASPNTQLVILVPFDGSKASAIIAGFNSYQTATPDSNCVLINLGTASTSITSDPRNMSGSVHLNAEGNALLAALMLAALQAANEPGPVTVTQDHGGTGNLTVEDPDGNPIAGATVQAYVSAMATTDASGHWSLTVQSGATYKLIVSKPGDESATASITV